MKLVDILAREMKVFPSSTDVVGQAKDGTLHLGYSHKPINGWTSEKYTMASDWEVAHVTHTEWKSAFDALNTPKPAEWSGEGLPPVGTVCEFCRFPEKCGAKWSKVEIVAHWEEGLGSPVAIFMSTGYAPQADQAVADRFRPVRTAEQIARIERMEAISAMDKVLSKYDTQWQALEKLYDAGYRKQVTP